MDQKSALLAGAKQCLVEKGYGQTTARDIAKASGSHLGSIGYHYGSKDKLMNQAVLELTDEWGDSITEAVSAAEGESPRERLATALTKIAETLPNTKNIQSASLQAFAQAQFDDDLREQLAAGGRTARQAFGRILAGQEETSTADISEAQLALGKLTHALTIGLVLHSLIDPDGMPDATQLNAALKLLSEKES